MTCQALEKMFQTLFVCRRGAAADEMSAQTTLWAEKPAAPALSSGCYSAACCSSRPLLVTVMTVPQRSHLCTIALAVVVLCIATWQIGQGLGGFGFDA